MENNEKKNETATTPQVNDKVKYILIAIAAVLVIVVVCIIAFGGKGSDKSTADNTAQTEVDTKIYTPTFKYFVSKSDSNYDEYMAMVDELKAEYNDQVTWDIVDIDEHPEAKDNFPVDNDTTPMLIMTNIHNDISAMEFKCSDKSRLKSDIDKSLAE